MKAIFSGTLALALLLPAAALAQPGATPGASDNQAASSLSDRRDPNDQSYGQNRNPQSPSAEGAQSDTGRGSSREADDDADRRRADRRGNDDEDRYGADEGRRYGDREDRYGDREDRYGEEWRQRRRDGWRFHNRQGWREGRGGRYDEDRGRRYDRGRPGAGDLDSCIDITVRTWRNGEPHVRRFSRCD
jgi:hypothetical protein